MGLLLCLAALAMAVMALCSGLINKFIQGNNNNAYVNLIYPTLFCLAYSEYNVCVSDSPVLNIVGAAIGQGSSLCNHIMGVILFSDIE